MAVRILTAAPIESRNIGAVIIVTITIITITIIIIVIRRIRTRIRIGFWGPLYYKYTKEPPQNSTGTYFRPLHSTST